MSNVHKTLGSIFSQREGGREEREEEKKTDGLVACSSKTLRVKPKL